MSRDPRAHPETEPTPQGPQMLIGGVRPLTFRDRLALRAAMRPAKPQKPCDLGLFDEGARNQLDFIDFIRAASSPPEPKEKWNGRLPSPNAGSREG